MKRVVIIFFILIIFPLTVNAERKEIEFDSCVDGDTIKAKIGGEVSTIRFLAVDTPELEAVTPAENAILEENGVFYIADNLDYKSVKQDKDFKALVDSVL